MASYNLITQPWIPARTTDGQVRSVGLEEILCEPAAFEKIESAHPTQVLAVMRLLLAITHRAVGPGNIENRTELLQDWPRAKVRSYLAKWHSRFDLYDLDRPFMQVPGLASVNELRDRPWTVLAIERASGNRRTLFDHTVDDDVPPISDAALMLQLLAHLQFAPGGLVQALRTSATRGAACSLLCVMAQGTSLHQTLALNLLPQGTGEYEKDLPSWEQDSPTVEDLRSGQGVVCAGPAQRYTFLSRAVLLGEPTADRVSISRYAAGLVMAASPTPDPMAAQRSGKDGPQPLLLREDRAFWRELQAMTSEQGGQPPTTLMTALSIKQEVGDFSPLDLCAGGFLPDQAKPVLWRLETRRIAPDLLMAGSGAVARLMPALQGAESTAAGLDAALWAACKNWLESGSSVPVDKSAVRGLLTQLNGLPRYWQWLEPRFWQFADQLGSGQDPDAALAAWSADLKSAVRNTWHSAVGQLGASARALSAAARAEPLLVQALGLASRLGKEA
jgi:CRISPR system Cascade subunit CasA